jgi:hypothetical protein
METQNNIPDLPKLSVYRYENFFNIYNDQDSDARFYNFLKSINIFPATNTSAEIEYTIEYGDSWTNISYKNYNTIDLWWLVCEYNQIKNPVIMPEAGTKIKILKAEYVSFVLSEISRQINL